MCTSFSVFSCASLHTIVNFVPCSRCDVNVSFCVVCKRNGVSPLPFAALDGGLFVDTCCFGQKSRAAN
eukprot:m.263588 g.263588  ORF g.263588 m.263588 type:complete len:68 (-) comp27044_c0_seq1:38-241(-)